MKIMLTGSTGGIGNAIKSKCDDAGFDTMCLLRTECDLSNNIDINYSNIDALIYCAGINVPASYEILSMNNINKTMVTNTFSFVQMCQQIHFNKGANIIAIGSLYATQTKAGRLAYSMSKHALYGAVKTLAIEMAIHKIKVNMVSPGFVLTPLTAKNNSQERIEYLQNTIPLGMTPPEDVADLCHYLLTNNSITGQNIIMDGGYSLLGI